MNRIDRLKQEQKDTEKEFQKQLKIIRNKMNKLQEKMDILSDENLKIYSLSLTKYYEYEKKDTKTM